MVAKCSEPLTFLKEGHFERHESKLIPNIVAPVKRFNDCHFYEENLIKIYFSKLKFSLT